MRRKRLIVIYYNGPGSEDLAESDFTKFYLPLRDRLDPKKNLTIHYEKCPDVKTLVRKIDELTITSERPEELYLHFSGHGTVAGIPYQDWTIANDNFAALLKHPKIKFCFFSSCRSAELSRLVSEAKVPVVIGTAGDNDINNNYAIDFQNIFYSKILQSFTIEDAYKAAVSYANQMHQKTHTTDIIVRGEGGGGVVGRAAINELEIYVTKAEEKYRYIIPPDWVMEMNQVGHDKPWCLNWFDDAVEQDLFYKKLEGEGLKEVFNWQDMPSTELYLLKDRANDDDPLAVGQTKLIFHFSKEELIPEEIRAYIEGKQSLTSEGVKVIFCFKEDLNKGVLFGDSKMLEPYPKSQMFEFDVHSSCLIANDDFIAALDNNEIPRTERRRIVLDFESRPLKTELYEIEETQETKGFAKVFFAQTFNDRLVNFVANWVKTSKMTNCISFVADNLANPDLNLLQDLEKQLQIHFSDRCRLAILIHRLYDYGSIIILRNRSSDPNTGYSIVKELLVQLQEAVEFFDHEVKFKGRTYSKEPILFFMLNEGLFQEPTSPSNKIWLKSLSKPVPVDDVMIKSWAEKYSHSSSASNKVVARVSKIAKEIKPQEDVGKCPSVVIESICNHFNIPLQNVLNL